MRKLIINLLVVLILTPSIAQASLREGLVGWWKFDEGSGLTAADSSGIGNDGDLTGHAPAWITGVRSGALDFTGSKYVTTNYVQTAVTNYTISVWFKTSTSGAVLVQDRGGGGGGMSLTISLGHWDANTIEFGVDSNAIYIGRRTNATYTDGAWHQAVCVFTSTSGQSITPSNFSIYMDGVVAATTDKNVAGSATSPLTGSSGTVIGYHVLWGQYFAGPMDDVRIYNRALNAGEINDLYQAQEGAHLVNASIQNARINY